MMDSILNEVQSIDVVPEYASFNEAAFYGVNYVEETYNEIIKSIGLEELSIYEATGDKSSKFAEFFKKIGAWFAKVWAAIKGFFEKLITMIGKMFKTMSAKIGKIYRGKITQADFVKAASKLPDDWKLEGCYTFDAFVGDKKYKKILDSTQKFADDCNREADDVMSGKIAPENITFNNRFMSFFRDFLGEPVSDMSSFKTAVDKYLRGEEVTYEKKDLEASSYALVKRIHAGIIAGIDGEKKDISESYKEIKKQIDRKIKEVKDAYHKARKAADDKKATDYYKTFVKSMKIYASTVTTVSGCVTSAYSARYKQYTRMAVKILKKIKPDKNGNPVVSDAPETSAEESAFIESSVFQSELSSLFNF